MNRRCHLRALSAFFAAPLAWARRKPDVWSTPQGQYCLMLRKELERLGYFDDLNEDWMAVERALAEGCMCFEIRSSRIEKSSGKVYARVAPVRLSVAHPPAWNTLDEVSYVDTKSWGT